MELAEKWFFLESNIFSSIIWHYLMILQTLANLAENGEKSCAMYNLPFKKPFFSMEFQDPKSESRLPVNNLLQLIRKYFDCGEILGLKKAELCVYLNLIGNIIILLLTKVIRN